MAAKNFFSEYVDMNRKNLYKYLKFIFKNEYDQEIAEEYVEYYINARYYNLSYKENNRVFYLRIKETLIKRMQELLNENEKEKKRTENFVEYRRRKKIITNMFYVFDYIFFFDGVRSTDNIKKLKNMEDVIDNLYEAREKDYLIKERVSTKKQFTELVKCNMEKNDAFLDKYFLDDSFKLEFKKYNDKKDLYDVKLLLNAKISEIYSTIAINAAFNANKIREERLVPEYMLLSLFVTRDIVETNFKDEYVVEFETSLLNKSQKLRQALDLIDDPALQDKIALKITYEQLLKYKREIFDLIKEGFRFALTIDTSFEDVEEIEKLQMFSYIIVPTFLKCSKVISKRYRNSGKILYI